MIPPDSPIDLALVIEEVTPDVEAAAEDDPESQTCAYGGETLVDGDCESCGPDPQQPPS